MKELEKIESAVQEMKDLYQAFVNRNGNSSLRLSNKEFNLWITKKLLEQDGKIVKLETRQKLVYLLLTAIIVKMLVIP